MKNIITISKQIKCEEPRKYGIDLLRILSMLFVVGLHFNQNCCFGKITEFNLNYVWVWVSEAIYYTSVDIFILITGFLRGWKIQPSLYNPQSRYRLYRIIFSVWFYSIIFLAIAFVTKTRNGISILASLIPIMSGSYWFISTYLLLMIVEPILVLVIKSDWFDKIYASLLIVFCILPTLIPFAGLDLKPSGANLIWFCVLYLSGYALRDINLNKGKAFILFCLSIIVPFGVKIAVKGIFGREQGGAVFYHHNSFFIFFAACSLLLVFKNMEIKNDFVRKRVFTISGACIGVYLIHENAYVRKWIWEYANYWIDYAAPYFPVETILFVTFVFIICIIFDIARKELFKIVCIENMEKHIDKMLVKIFKKLFFLIDSVTR